MVLIGVSETHSGWLVLVDVTHVITNLGMTFIIYVKRNRGKNMFRHDLEKSIKRPANNNIQTCSAQIKCATHFHNESVFSCCMLEYLLTETMDLLGSLLHL